MAAFKKIYSIVLFAIGFHCAANIQSPEGICLRNIKQITFPSMGFVKAGESYFSPDGKTLIFQAVPTRETQYQIYSIDVGSSTPHLVSTGEGACTCAFFRPDGKKIIFASSHEAPIDFKIESKAPGYKRGSSSYSWEFTPHMNIYEANPDGSDLKALTTGPAYNAECAYSHDGSKIVFASNRSGTMNLYTMNADGSNVQQVTHTTQGYNGGPFFCPDDTAIIYRADYEKKDYLQIYSIGAQGGGMKQLTNNNAVNWAPCWHPRGDVIAFTTSLHGHAQYEIYLMNIQTGITYRLTHHAGFDGLPSFNKDGTQISWTSKRGPDKTCQIFIADFIMPETL